VIYEGKTTKANWLAGFWSKFEPIVSRKENRHDGSNEVITKYLWSWGPLFWGI